MNAPKIIKLTPQPENGDVISFQRAMYALKDVFDRVDRAGVAIGEEDLALNMVSDIQVALMYFSRPAVRNSIRPVPPAEPSRKEGISKEKEGYRNLKAEMVRKGLHQKDIAKALGCSVSTASKKINRKTPIYADEAISLSQKLFPDSDLNYLFDNIDLKTTGLCKAHQRSDLVQR